MKRRIATWTLMAVLFILMAGPGLMPRAALARPLDQSGTLDQSNDVSAQSYLGTIFQQAQTFTAGRTGLLDRVDLKGFNSGSPGQGTIEITAVDQNGIPTGPALGSGSYDSSTLPQLGGDLNAGGWLSVPISPAVPVSAGVQYAIVKPASTPFRIIWSLSIGNTYPQGIGTPDEVGQPYDYLFRTYVFTSAFPATTVLDDFNRANGKVGGNWDGLNDQAFYKIASNKLDVQIGGPLVWKPAAFGMTQEAFVTLSTIDTRSRSQGVLLKVQTGTMPDAGAISVVYDAKAKAVRVSALRLERHGAWTLYPNQAATFVNGDVLGARAKANGTVEIYKNGTLITTVTLNAADQAFFNAKGGKIGIWTLGASNALLDDFGGGTVAP